MDFVSGPISTGLASYLKIITRNGHSIDFQFDIGVSLLQVAFQMRQRSVALNLANISLEVVREILGQERDNARRATARKLVKIMLQGLKKAIRNGFKDQVIDLLEDRSKTFSDAIRRNDERTADSISAIGLFLLVEALEENPYDQVEVDACWVITDYLSKFWVIELDRAKLTTGSLVKKLISARVDDTFNDFIREGSLEYGKTLIKALMEISRGAVTENKGDILKIISESVVKTLDRGIKEGQEDQVRFLVREGVTTISSAIKNLEMRKTTAILKAGCEILIAAIELNTGSLVDIVAESLMVELNQVMQDRHFQAAQYLMDSWTRMFVNREACWKAATKILSTSKSIEAKSLARTNLTETISRSWIEALHIAIDGCPEDKLEELIMGNISSDGAPLSLFDLFLAAIEHNKTRVTECLLNCWVRALEGEIERNYAKEAGGLVNMVRQHYIETLGRGDKKEADKMSNAARRIWQASQGNVAVQSVLQSAEWIQRVND